MFESLYFTPVFVRLNVRSTYVLAYYLVIIKEIKMQGDENEPKMGKFQQLQSQISEQLRQKWKKQQLNIRDRILQKNGFAWTFETLELIAGVDISASKKDTDIACAVLIIYSIKSNKSLYEQTEIFNIGEQPYIPGFLAFRQVPILHILFERLKQKRPELWPQLLLVDGNGILHQNQCGLACHLGVLIDLPAIGVGKTLFYIDGLSKDRVKLQCENQIKAPGDFSFLKGDSGKVWGAAVRNSQNAVNPIFVSIGHRIQLDLALNIILKLSLYRVVEPIRLADKRSRELVEAWKGQKHELPSFPMIYI